MAKITLMRHSVSEANEEGICDSGRLDASLSVGGQSLAQVRAARVRECPDAIYTSNMKRAVETAEIYAQALKKKFGCDVPVIPVARLRGQDNGLLEGLFFNSPEYEIMSTMMSAAGPSDYGGESNLDARRRQLEAFLEIAASIENSGYQNVLVITHNDTIIRFRRVMQKMPFPIKSPENCERVGPLSTHKIVKKITAFLYPDRKPAPKPPGNGI